MAIDERQLLAEALRECAERLAASASDGAPLRKLQQVAHSIVESASSASVRTVAFILDEWIDDYYLNLAGDIVFPWKKVEEIRESLLREQTVKALLQLAEAVEKTSVDVLKGLEELVVSYLDAVNRANRVVTESQ